MEQRTAGGEEDAGSSVCELFVLNEPGLETFHGDEGIRVALCSFDEDLLVVLVMTEEPLVQLKAFSAAAANSAQNPNSLTETPLLVSIPSLLNASLPPLSFTSLFHLQTSLPLISSTRLPLLLSLHHLTTLPPIPQTISPSLLNSCTDLPKLKQVHSLLLSNGVQTINVAPKLITLYANFNDLHSALSVFKALSEPNSFLWNLIMKTHVDSGFADDALRLYSRMRVSSVSPDHFTFPIVNRALSLAEDRLGLAGCVHCVAIQMGFGEDLYYCNTLIDLYVKKYCVWSARKVFDGMPDRDLVSWTTMISGYVSAGNFFSCFGLFREMLVEGLEPNLVTLLIMLRACSFSGNAVQGKEIHGHAFKEGFESEGSLVNAILTMYGKTSNLKNMVTLFHNITNRDAVSWNIMISTFSRKGDYSKVAQYFTIMKTELAPNLETLSLVVSASAKSGNFFYGKEIHCYAVKTGLSDVVLQTSLVDFYVKCGQLGESIKLFNEVSEKNGVTWVAMLSGFIQSGHFKEAMALFSKLQFSVLKSEVAILSSLVALYTDLGVLWLGKGVHGFILRNTIQCPEEDTAALETSILNMYAKCGSIVYARRCFDRMAVKDVVAWSSMIEGYGTHGLGYEALKLFSQMQRERVRPNRVTFLNLLSACCHSGLVSEGCMVFSHMSSRFGIEPDVNLYTCMVDLLGRSGELRKALEIIKSMTVQPDSRTWGALLAASRVHSDIEIGTLAAQRLSELELDNAGYNTLLSSIHASAERWHEAEDVRRLMNEKQMTKKPGWSYIEDSRGSIHGFVAGDESHPKVGEIFELLSSLSKTMEEFG
ncbi:hypothetical protein Scep_023314 [Stephania cephalantha]|uniref:Pentatricopeptide repeat-containing protein n=1 Tax=Stephania cephalantha TaxID=152367 RepID=A0AAP0HX79_9MAGN